MQTRILIMIEMLTQNPDVAKPKHRLVQSMPFSMVDPRSTKPNKHFPLIFGRFWTSMCTWLQSNPEILWSFVCLQRIQYVQTGSLFLLLQSQRCAMQSTSLNIICNCCTSFTVVIDYWKCVYVTFDLFIVFCTFLGKYIIPRFCFLKKTFQKRLSIILPMTFLWVLGRCVPLNSPTCTCMCYCPVCMFFVSAPRQRNVFSNLKLEDMPF